MPAVLTRPHVAGITGLLTAAGLTVVPGGQGDLVMPCVVLWPEPGRPHGSLGDPLSMLTSEVTTVACGSTADQAMWVADKVTATLAGVRPTVAGRTVHPLILVDTSPVQRDDDLAAGIWFASIRWRLVTSPT